MVEGTILIVGLGFRVKNNIYIYIYIYIYSLNPKP